MSDLSFQKSPDKSQIFYFLLCYFIDLFIPVAILESVRLTLFNHAQSLQLSDDKGHTIWPGREPHRNVNNDLQIKTIQSSSKVSHLIEHLYYLKIAYE